MSNFLFISWIFVNKNFSCLQDFGCTTTPAAKAIHRVPTSLGLQSKQTHWISPKLVPAPEECSPVLFPYPWLHFRAELHTPQSSKETLPKVSDSFNISIQRSVYVWECAAQPYGLYGKTCYCTMIQKAGCKKIHMGQTLFNLDFHANRLLLWLWKPLQGQDIQDMYFVEEGSVCLFVCSGNSDVFPGSAEHVHHPHKPLLISDPCHRASSTKPSVKASFPKVQISPCHPCHCLA